MNTTFALSVTVSVLCASIVSGLENAAPHVRDDVDVRLQLASQPYYVGEPMRFDVIVTNRSMEHTVFFYHHGGDRARQHSGLIITVIRLDTGRESVAKYGLNTKWSSIVGPGSEVLSGDIGKLFKLEYPANYRLSVGIVDFLIEGHMENGQHVEQIRKRLDIQSPPVEFEVRGVDEELLARVVRLLDSGARDEKLEGVTLLETARAELFRRAAPSLAPLIRSRDGVVRAATLKLFVSRIELAESLCEELTDDELVEALDAARRASVESVRLLTAKAVSFIVLHFERHSAMRIFIDRRMGEWVASEPSVECRHYLVEERLLGRDVAARVIRSDPSPQIRAVAARQMSVFDPDYLLKVAGSLGTFSGEVEMDGKRQPLADFVAKEIDEARKRVESAAEGVKSKRAADEAFERKFGLPH